MAKIRAYKLAEELGIDRLEFVEKALAAVDPLLLAHRDRIYRDSLELPLQF